MLMCARVSSDKEHPPQNIWQGKSHTASWKPISWLGCKSKLWDSQDYNDGGWKSWIPTIWWVNKTIYKICLQHEGREKPHLTCTATHSLHSAAWLSTQKASNIHNAIHYMQLLCAPKPFCWRCPLEMSMIKCPMLHEDGSMSLWEADTSGTKIRRESAHWTQLCCATFSMGKYNLFLSPGDWILLIWGENWWVLFTFACLRKKKNHRKKKR